VAQSTLQRSGQKLAESAEKIKDSTYRVEDSAERTTQLAADRTVFAAERTYAAWVRTGLLALASGIGAKALLAELLPQWLIIATGSVLVLFSAFCFGAAVWRHLYPGVPLTANRCVAPPALDFNRREWISRARGARCSRRHLVRPSDPTGLMPLLRGAGSDRVPPLALIDAFKKNYFILINHVRFL
jgi:putative membrane protein